MLEGIEIRRLRPGDEGLLSRVDPEIFDHEIEPRYVAGYLADPGHMMFIALGAGLVIGQCSAIVHRHVDAPNELYVDNLGVAVEYRRRGIARALLEAAYELGRSMGCEETWVATEIDNEEARALYASYGAEAETFVMFLRDL